MPLVDGALPADVAEVESHRVAALSQATAELRQARQLVESITRASELAELLRSAPPLLARIRTLEADAIGQHRAVLERHEACAGQLTQAARQLDEMNEHIQEIMRVAEIEPKLERIHELIALLDQAELIRWHR